MACMYERAVILPDQYPDRFDQLVSTVGVIENRWIHSGTVKLASVKIDNRRWAPCFTRAAHARVLKMSKFDPNLGASRFNRTMDCASDCERFFGRM